MKLPSMLIVQQSPDWGGAESWMLEIIRAFVEDGTRVILYTNLGPLREAARSYGAQTFSLPFHLDIIGNWKGLLKSLIVLPYAILFYLWLAFRHRRIDVVLMSGFSEKMLFTLIAATVGIPVVWYEYADLRPVFQKLIHLPEFVYRRVARLPRAILTLSPHTAEIMRSHYKIRMKVISPWVRPPSNPSKSATHSGVVFGCLARVAPEKGQRILLEAFSIIRHTNPEWKLKIAGKGPDLEWLRQYLDQNDLSSQVEVLGFVDDPHEFYRSLDIFVMPSIWELEGFGLVSVEAMAAGVPVICFDRPPMNHVITASTGLLVAHETPEGLAEAMICLASDRSIRAKLSKLAKKRVVTHYQYQRQFSLLKEELCKASRL